DRKAIHLGELRRIGHDATALLELAQAVYDQSIAFDDFRALPSCKDRHLVTSADEMCAQYRAERAGTENCEFHACCFLLSVERPTIVARARPMRSRNAVSRGSGCEPRLTATEHALDPIGSAQGREHTADSVPRTGRSNTGNTDKAASPRSPSRADASVRP